MIKAATIKISGLPFVYTTLPINGPNTLPIERIVCLIPTIFPLFVSLVYKDNSFCSKGVIYPLIII